VGVAEVPDADGDGVADHLVGANSEAAGAAGAGRAYLFSGATGALVGTLQSPNAENSGFFGLAVAGVPDVNGDGRGDLLVGAYQEDGPTTNSGRAYLFSGGALVPAEPGPLTAGVDLAVRPNPLGASGSVTLALDRPRELRVAVHDVLGREVALLHAGLLAAGAHVLPLDASSLPAGLYLLVARGADGAAVRRLTVRP
jgi:hypothetical protein